MKGIVLETKNEYAAVLKDDGTIVRVKGAYAVGETIEVTKKTGVSSGHNRVIKFARVAAIAAAVILIVLGTGGYYYTAVAASTVTIYAQEGEVKLSLNRLDRVIHMEVGGNVRDDDVKALYDGGIKNSTLPDALDKVSGLLGIKEETDTGMIPIDIETGNNDKYERMRSQAEERGFMISSEIRDEAPVDNARPDTSMGELPKEQISETLQEADQPQAFEQPKDSRQSEEQIGGAQQEFEQYQEGQPVYDLPEETELLPGDGIDRNPAASADPSVTTDPPADMSPANTSPVGDSSGSIGNADSGWRKS